MPDLKRMITRLRQRYAGWQNGRRIAHLARQVAEHSHPRPGQPPVVFFNASTRLTGLSLNAAFSLLGSWGLRLAGVPVIHFVSQSGMSRCVLGTDRDDPSRPPPCGACTAQSQRLFAGADVRPFTFRRDPALAATLQDLSLAELSAFEYPNPWAGAVYNAPAQGPAPIIPLGPLVLPSLRWALRQHHLPDDEPTRFLLREYLLSAHSVACEFAAFLNEIQPAAVVVFNGIMYPEATVRWTAQQRGLRVITHEVSFQRFSAFFTDGIGIHATATAYPLDIPDGFELSDTQNARLDAYLEQRVQGRFTMAGIRFWPEMRGLDAAFLEKADRFRQVVPVFTNVVFDTSQVHANVVFPHMFAWLDLVLTLIRAHPETLFVLRAHPDEMRPGTRKQSRESVRDWVRRNEVDRLPNVVFIDSHEYVSSYELIQRSRFVLVYNSSIGLEATLFGRAVLCGGRARYTQVPTVHFPATPQAYREMAQAFLSTGLGSGAEEPAPVPVPPEFERNARRFLYYQLFRASLSFDDYLQPGPRPGFVGLKPFSWQDLLPENSTTIQVLIEGILDGKPFLIPEKK